MSVGLPRALGRDAVPAGIANASHVGALVALVIGIAIALISSIDFGGPSVWGSVAMLLGFAVVLVIVHFWPTVSATLAYLFVGTAVVLVTTIAVLSQETLFLTSNNVLIALPMAALVLVCGAGANHGASAAIGAAWTCAAWALGEASAFLGVVLAGHGSWQLNLPAAIVFVVALAARGYEALARGARERHGSRLEIAGRQARKLELRRDRELVAIARLHDTALDHLLEIAAAGSGPVDERLRAGIRRDFSRIIGRDWADEAVAGGSMIGAATAAATPRSPAAIDVEPPKVGLALLPAARLAADHAGLLVETSGDFRAVTMLAREQVDALDGAIAQCLANVARHAGVDTAEVVIGVGGAEVTVAVIDSGRGFDLAAVPSDRIGLRLSIRARIERAGGVVRLWTTEGVGTTVVMSMPLDGRR